MSKDLIAIIGVGISLAGLILYSQHNLRAEMLDLREENRAEFREVHEEFKAVRSEMKAEFNIHLEAINRLREDVGQLQERVVRQEGLIEGLREAMSQLQGRVVRQEGLMEELREAVSQLQGRLARQEGLMEGLRDAIVGTHALIAEPGKARDMASGGAAIHRRKQ